ncbi:MAG: DMT family transporter [Spirochaetota bacterium]
MNVQTVRSNIMLLLTALIWGFAFVAQRVGMENIGPFAFNGIRFALGAFSIIPIIIFLDKKNGRSGAIRKILPGGIAAGLVLFLGASLQQIGIIYTTAGKAGFITGMYVVLVPISGLFFRQKTGFNIWIGALFAAAGLYLLGVTGDFTVGKGDLLVLASAVFWTAHVQLINFLSKKVDPLKLSFVQYMTCSAISLITAFFTETITMQGISGAAAPILYGGLMSVGVAYTLQVVAQKHAHPSHAAIIMSMETVFAALGGFLLLHETLSPRDFAGCALMLAGMILSQMTFPARGKKISGE